MADYGFGERAAFSEGRRQATDIETIRAMLAGCVSVEATEGRSAENRAGVDYIATLRGGAVVNIDAKARESGCSRFWGRYHNDDVIPQLAVETWSVVGKKAGWTLDESKRTDLILYTFDPADTEACYLVGFQHLRMAFRANEADWRMAYDEKGQTSNGGEWASRCLFVPAPVVLDAISAISIGRARTA